jgi:hypothetical protein
MKKKVVIFGVLATMLSVITIAQIANKKGAEPIEAPSKVEEYKEKTREKLKPFRYDGTKITHFNYMKYDQTKEIEVLLFNGNEYKLCFNGEGAPVGIKIRIYDISKEAAGNYPEKRILLKEISDFKSETIVETKELNTSYTTRKEEIYTSNCKAEKKEPDATTLKSLKALKLKRVFIEYFIPEAEYVLEQLPPKSKEEPKKVPQKGFCVVTYGYKNA